MKLEEINQLAFQETIGNLRNPKTVENLDEKAIFNSHQTFLIIVNKILHNPSRERFLKSSFGKCIMHKVGVLELKLKNEEIGIYHIKSIFGEGEFYDARRLFANGKYPKWINPGYCFSNTFYHVMMTGINANVESGIAFKKKPFLHSVLAVGDYIVDFNYDLVISKNLYYALMHFELLSTVEGEKIRKIRDDCFNRRQIFDGMQDYMINFAYDDVMEIVRKNKGITY